jgi:hypothetical protein
MTKAFVCLAILLFMVSASAQSSGAHDTASGEQAQNYIMGATSAAAGAATMKIEYVPAHKPTPDPMSIFMFYVAGPAMIAAGIADVAKGAGRQGAIDATAGNPYGSTGGSFNPGGGSVPGFVSTDLQNAIDTAKSMGIDPTNPDSLAAAKSKAASMGADGGGGGSASSFTPSEELKAAVEDAKKKVEDQFKVAGIGFEGGGGGRRGHHSNDDADLAALLDGLKNGDRGPASVDGLQKTFNGEPIGVAADNIFAQVTRRYQAKIQANTFISEVPAKTMGKKLTPKK